MSFTIKCDKCGLEQNLQSIDKHDSGWWENKDIKLFVSATSIDFMEINIDCSCGNHQYEY